MSNRSLGAEVFELEPAKLRWLISRDVFFLMLALGSGFLFQGSNPRERMVWLLLLVGFVLFVIQFLKMEANAPRIPISLSDRLLLLSILQRSDLTVDAVISNESDTMPKCNIGILKIPHSCLNELGADELGWIVTSVICRERAQVRLIRYTCGFVFVLWILAWVLSVSSVTDQIPFAGIILFFSAIIIQVFPLMAWSWKTPDAIATRIYGVEASEKVLRRLLELAKEKNGSVDEVLLRADYLGLEIRNPREYVRN